MDNKLEIRSNKLMEEYLSSISYNFLEKSILIPEDLRSIIDSRFLVHNDCVLLKELCSVAPEGLNEIEKCEYEDSENHFHPDSFVDSADDDLQALKYALECGKHLASRLGEEFGTKRRFRIQISFSEKIEVDGEISEYTSSTVRFYQIRSECDKKMLVGDLERFQLDAIVEIET